MINWEMCTMHALGSALLRLALARCHAPYYNMEGSPAASQKPWPGKGNTNMNLMIVGSK